MGADVPKQFRLLDGVPVVVFTLRRLAACPLISKFLVATHADEIGPLHQRIAAEHLSRPVRVLPGGDTRQESVAKALSEVPPETEFVLVHDAVRPLVTRDQVERVIRVHDEEIVSAMRLAWERAKLLIEPSAAVALAAVLVDEFRALAGAERVGIILSGGNVDLDRLPW